MEKEVSEYKEVSDISDATEESYPDGLEILKEGTQDLDNYDKLMEVTRKKLRIIDGKFERAIHKTKPGCINMNSCLNRCFYLNR